MTRPEESLPTGERPPGIRPEEPLPTGERPPGIRPDGFYAYGYYLYLNEPPRPPKKPERR